MQGFYLFLLTVGFLAIGITLTASQTPSVNSSQNLPAATPQQELKTMGNDDFKSFEYFNQIAEESSPTKVFKLLQFTAPYDGFFKETDLNINGEAFTAVVMPNWATQSGRFAVLSAKQVRNTKWKLADFISKVSQENVEPQTGQEYSTLIVSDGQKMRRYNFIGQSPKEIQAIIDFLNKKFEKTEKAKQADFLKEHKLN